GDTTAVSLFCNGVPFLNTVLPIGGNQITSDIARTLNIALSSAERVKKVHGSALAHTSSIGGTRAEFQAKCATGDTRNFSCHALSCIIRPLIEDIFTNIDNYLVQHQPYAASIGRVVLTGGAAQLSGVPEVARIILKRDTRLATPNHISGLPDIASHSDSAACVGLLQHAQNAARDVISAEDDQLISKVAHWLERYI
ncbi:MAG: hypothetical protein HAW64_03105, partial [Alphaproteobacteria bacterium]|nr:hypothetical protein [Alphaproteobacteria bacterium]